MSSVLKANNIVSSSCILPATESTFSTNCCDETSGHLLKIDTDRQTETLPNFRAILSNDSNAAILMTLVTQQSLLEACDMSPEFTMQATSMSRSV